jgi:DNA-binding transcriptional regulator YiaG
MRTTTQLETLVWLRRAIASGEARRLRIRSGVSQGAIAKTVGVTAASVSRWERGLRRPRGEVAELYVRALIVLHHALETEAEQ